MPAMSDIPGDVEAVEPEAEVAEQPSAQEAHREKRESALNAAISEHLLGEKDEEDLAEEASQKGEEPEEDEDEGQEPLPEEDEDLEDAGEDGEQASDEEEADEPEEDEEDLLMDAMVALRASGVPASVIKSTPKAKLIAWGEKVIAQREAKNGSAPKSHDASEKPDGSAEMDEGHTPAQDASFDRSAHAKAFADELGVDEEAASKALKPLHDAIDTMRETLKGMRSEVQEASKAALAREGQATIDMQMRRLERKYPELAKSTEMSEAIIERVAEAVQGKKALGRRVDLSSVFDEAALAVRGKPKRSDMKKLRRLGVSSGPTTRPSEMGGFDNEDDYFARVIDHVDAGRIDAARRLQPPPIRQPKRS